MAASRKRTLLRLSRTLGIVFALFLSLFAFDVFEMGGSFWQTAAAFLLHLIPAALVLVAVVLSWRWPWLGGLLFFALAGLYVALVRGPLAWYLLVAGPLLIIGLLFLWAWAAGKQIEPQP